MINKGFESQVAVRFLGRSWLSDCCRRIKLVFPEANPAESGTADDKGDDDENEDDEDLDVEQPSDHHFECSKECGLVMAWRHFSRSRSEAKHCGIAKVRLKRVRKGPKSPGKHCGCARG